jgi:hypothetical protein
MKYSNIVGKKTIRNTYTDDEGEIYEMDSGKTETIYSTPTVFLANISMSGSDSNFTEYGLSTADYEAVINLTKDEYPIVEGAIIWLNSEVVSRYDEETEVVLDDGSIVYTTSPDHTSADYVVIKKSTSINQDRYILKAVNK